MKTFARVSPPLQSPVGAEPSPPMLKRAWIFMFTSLLYVGASNGSLYAADTARLTLYRVTVPKSELMPSLGDLQHLPPTLPNLLQCLLSAKDKCIVETLGFAPVSGGAFALDTTSEVHFLSPQEEKSLVVQTADSKIGLAFSGTLEKQESGYLLSIDIFDSHITKRLTLPEAPDIAGGRPVIESTKVNTRVFIDKNVPAQIFMRVISVNDVTVSKVFVVVYSE